MKDQLYLEHQRRVIPYARRHIVEMRAHGVDKDYIRGFRKGVLAGCKEFRANCNRFLPFKKA